MDSFIHVCKTLSVWCEKFCLIFSNEEHLTSTKSMGIECIHFLNTGLLQEIAHCGMEWYSLLWYDTRCYDTLEYSILWYDTITELDDMIHYSIVYYGMIQLDDMIHYSTV